MTGLLQEIDAVTIPVSDLEKGLSFYRDGLGHEVIWRNESLGPGWASGAELDD
ncbi:MAG: VOC family protein [Acidimicrobiales bacterium]